MVAAVIGQDLCRNREHFWPRRNRDRRRTQGGPGRGRHGHGGADPDQAVGRQTRALRDVGLDRTHDHQVGQEIRLRPKHPKHLTALGRDRGRRADDLGTRRVDKYLGGCDAHVVASALRRERRVVGHEHPGEQGGHTNACDVTPKAP